MQTHTHHTPKVEPRILRTHRLITKGVSRETADAFIMQAASNLQSLGQSPRLHIAPAPAQLSLQELLSRASETAKTFTPRPATLNTEAA